MASFTGTLSDVQGSGSPAVPTSIPQSTDTGMAGMFSGAVSAVSGIIDTGIQLYDRETLKGVSEEANKILEARDQGTLSGVDATAKLSALSRKAISENPAVASKIPELINTQAGFNVGTAQQNIAMEGYNTKKVIEADAVKRATDGGHTIIYKKDGTVDYDELIPRMTAVTRTTREAAELKQHLDTLKARGELKKEDILNTGTINFMSNFATEVEPFANDILKRIAGMDTTDPKNQEFLTNILTDWDRMSVSSWNKIQGRMLEQSGDSGYLTPDILEKVKGLHDKWFTDTRKLIEDGQGSAAKSLLAFKDATGLSLLKANPMVANWMALSSIAGQGASMLIPFATQSGELQTAFSNMVGSMAGKDKEGGGITEVMGGSANIFKGEKEAIKRLNPEVYKKATILSNKVAPIIEATPDASMTPQNISTWSNIRSNLLDQGDKTEGKQMDLTVETLVRPGSVRMMGKLDENTQKMYGDKSLVIFGESLRQNATELTNNVSEEWQPTYDMATGRIYLKQISSTLPKSEGFLTGFAGKSPLGTESNTIQNTKDYLKKEYDRLTPFVDRLNRSLEGIESMNKFASTKRADHKDVSTVLVDKANINIEGGNVTEAYTRAIKLGLGIAAMDQQPPSPVTPGTTQQQQSQVNTSGINIDKLAEAQIKHESAGDTNAVSSKGAVGKMQLQLATAKEVASKIGITEPITEEVLKKNPDLNVKLGKAYMQENLKRFDGNVEYALVAYNWGPTNASNWVKKGASWRKLPKETRDYVEKVMATYES